MLLGDLQFMQRPIQSRKLERHIFKESSFRKNGTYWTHLSYELKFVLNDYNF